MYKKITAFAIIIILCFSMITPVFAATTANIAGSDITWIEKVYDGETYKISYWHPKGYDKLIIQDVSGSYYFGNYILLFYNDSTVFDTTKNDRMFITNGTALKVTIEWSRMGSNTPEVVLNNIKSMLFGDDSAGYKNLNFTLMTCSNESTSWTGQNNLGYYEYDTTAETFEEDYANWYLENNGAEPPLKGSSDTTMEYNCGRYYVIIRQKGQLNQNGKYVVDSIGDLEFDEQYIYSVICPSVTMNLDGETSGTNFFELTPGTKIWNTITGKFKPEHNGQLQKEGYESTGTLGNLKWYYAEINDMYKNGAWDRYYFTSLTEAVRFTKSGAWAQPLYGEIGLQHYVYNVDKIHYNNFYINNDYPINEPNFEEYGMTRTKVFLKQHGVENPKYIYVEYDYAPYKSQLTKNWIFGIYYRDNPIYYVGNSTATDFIPTDTSFYTETEEYYETKTQRFQIWYEGIEDETDTWDIIKSDWSLNVGTESTSRVETLEDEAGNKITINHQTGILYDKDGNEYYYNEETGEYINKDGEIFDLDNFKPVDKDFTDAEVIEDITGLFDRIIQIINDTKHHTEGIVKFLGAIFTRLPSIFTTIIILALIALLIKRAVGRGD